MEFSGEEFKQLSRVKVGNTVVTPYKGPAGKEIRSSEEKVKRLGEVTYEKF